MRKMLVCAVVMVFGLSLFADPKGEEVARRNFALAESEDCSSTTMMVLINKRGEKQVRMLNTYSKKTKKGRDTFMHFTDPAQVMGTTYLIFGYDKGDDEQRLFLPALGKIRKIAASNKDQKFMGSDLFYYDMEDHDFDDFTYKYVKEETYEGMVCDVIEMYPTDKYSPYSKQVAWISRTDNFSYKVECYDKKRTTVKIKTIVSLSVKNFKGVLIPQQVVIDNHKENHKTLLQDTNIKVNSGLSADIFTIQNMQK